MYMFYLILIIAMLTYLVYTGKESSETSESKTRENSEANVNTEQKEIFFSDKIKTNRLKDYVEIETVLFDYGRKNFVCLEKHLNRNDTRLARARRDWMDYIDILHKTIYENEMLDVATSNEIADEHRKKRQELFVKIREIDKRFKNLLGDEYIDPWKFIKSQQKN